MLNKITLTEFIYYEIPQDELKKLMQSKTSDNFRLQWIDTYRFKFISNASDGTMLFLGSSVEGIKGFAHICKISQNKTLLILETKIRTELYTILVFLVIIVLAGLFSKEAIPIWIYGVAPISLYWFWYTYRVQEKKLFETLKKFIKETQ